VTSIPDPTPSTGRGRLVAIRVIAVLTILTGTAYLVWRWGWSLNLAHWWIAVPLVIAETYALIDGALFAVTIWRMKVRGAAPAPPRDATVDVFITTYNEPVELVAITARAAKAIDWPHLTWILDDGARPEMREIAEELGVGYLTRSADWTGKSRHAKAGNLNNALFQTSGEFLLILDADQIPQPQIVSRMLGWFEDAQVALVQSPQWFSNVEDSDPLGSQAPLFYGPVQQGKDGWNAAFFCGSNAMLRREALMRLGIAGYVRQTERSARSALTASRRVLADAERQLARQEGAHAAREAVHGLRAAADTALARIGAGEPVQSVTWDFQRTVDAASRALVSNDLESIRRDLRELGALPDDAANPFDEGAVVRLAEREWSPLTAIERVSALIHAVDVDRSDEALPVMPVSSLSVTEDMETCMLLHSHGWKSVYHHEILATGLAPEDLPTMLTQRLRWAQGTMQVLLRLNPLTQPGLAIGQRLSYFATMWSYLTGFAALAFLAAPILYLTSGATPVEAWGSTFLAFFLPNFLLNQALFAVVGYGVKTWRGQQYTLALFPIWIKALTTAAANVWFGRPLGFAVTDKSGASGRTRFPAGLIWPQLAFMGALIVAVPVGIVLLLAPGQTAPVGPLTPIGVVINSVWALYDVVVLSVIVRAALYRGPEAVALPNDAVSDDTLRNDKER